jgi:glycosyltransferase involved in cell wall biosynthesis
MAMNVNRILIISEAHLIKTFVLPTIKKLKSEVDVIFDCFVVAPLSRNDKKLLYETFDHVFENQYPKGILKKIPRLRVWVGHYGRKQVAHSLPEYDVAHIHFHHHYFSYFTPIIRKKAKKFYVTFFGSDFNQVEEFRHRHNQKSVDLTDAVFATSTTLLNKISHKYQTLGKGIKSDILIPLIDTFDVFETFLQQNTRETAKKAWEANGLTLVCGYNAAPITRHKMIVDALSFNTEKLKDAKIIFPMTYGNQAEHSRFEVKNYLNDKKVNAIILEEYLSVEKLQLLRLAADIFIHIQSRDQMAASMLEHLAAGSVVITGSWLPYASLTEKGVYMVLIENPQDLTTALPDVIDHLEEHRQKSLINRQIILELMSWKSIKENWYKYYELEIGI